MPPGDARRSAGARRSSSRPVGRLRVPPRALAALLLAAIVVAVALATSFLLLRATPRTGRGPRKGLAIAVVVTGAALAFWIIFIAPAYWD